MKSFKQDLTRYLEEFQGRPGNANAKGYITKTEEFKELGTHDIMYLHECRNGIHDITALLPEQTEHGVRISTIAGVLFGPDTSYKEDQGVLEISNFYSPPGYGYTSLEPGKVGFNVMKLARAYAAVSGAGMIQGNIVDFAEPGMHEKMKRFMPVLPAFTSQNIRLAENFDNQSRAQIRASAEEKGLIDFLEVADEPRVDKYRRFDLGGGTEQGAETIVAPKAPTVSEIKRF